ncbi:aminotransferase class I/II-fold pyridoxal phosphate-dependent enzyme [Micromonospora rubida]|uniref:aminotransferase class I/II-fold pyridoxal phosphate-dependent enzyme n=1 Tax=Micromonospora rubida TaxID=2697657 RepID=UPI001377CF2B|nr:aminotransferase class I/II-fold pyridoxal phosphate-dependent enzyme [Micromonospora rubida]NBE84042.1 aminotransferase class I/II-fold pyridoxal phosphate-dependent enzyme [Micromonospora rubida]
MDISSPPGLGPALSRALAQSTWGYTYQDPAVLEAVTAWYADRHRVTVAPNHVLTAALPPKVTLRAVLAALGCGGRTVVVEPPVYGGFRNAAAAVGASCVPAPLSLVDGTYRRDLAALDAVLRRHRPRAILLCSPQNPLGRVWDAVELDELLRLCAGHGVAVVSDEVHSDLVLDADRTHTPAISVRSGAEVVIVSSPGKTFNVSGVPSSFVIGGDEAVTRAVRGQLNTWGVHPGSLVTDAMMVHLYTAEAAWLDQLVAELRRLRATLLAELATVPGLTVMRPTAGFLAWIDCRGLDPSGPAGRWFAERGVDVVGGTEFGSGYDGFVRWNYATDPTLLRAAVERLGAPSAS